MSALPPSSLIICSRNRPQLLMDTVQSVLAGEAVPTEIVIIDQSASPHATLPTLRTDRPCEIRYCQSRSAGLSRARNEAIAASRHECMVSIDDDMFVAADWYRAMLQALMEAGARAAVTGQVQAYEEAPGGFVPATTADDKPAVYEGRILADVLSGCNFAIRRSAFGEVGDFDERLGPGGLFPSADDNDFGYRLLQAGYRIVYAPEAVVYHRAWRSAADYVALRWIYGCGQGGFFAKHLRWHDRFMLRRIGASLRRYGDRIVRFYAWHRSRQQIWGDIVYLAGMFWGILRWRLTQPHSPTR